MISKAAYVVLGINQEGNKEKLGFWVSGNESRKFRLGVLNDLKTRGVKTVTFFCVDSLTGMKEAIRACVSICRYSTLYHSSNPFEYEIRSL